MTLFLLLNPKQYGGVAEKPDTSDILDVYRKRKKKQLQEEEELAVKILLERYKEQYPEEQPKKINFDQLLSGALQTQFYGLDAHRQMRIKQLFILMLLDDD